MVYTALRKLRYWILFFPIFMCATVYAQEASTVSGAVLEKGSMLRLADVNVKNLSNNKSVRSSSFGIFTLAASIGDSLSFSKVGYGSVTYILYSMTDLLVEMQAGLELETVVVNRMSKEAELNAYLEDYKKKGIYNNGENKFGTYLASPATALYNLFGREAKNAKRFSSLMDRELQATKVDRIFNKSLVQNLTKLEGDDLQAFMDMYRPSYTSIEHWGQYDVMSYIKRSFDEFEKNGRPKMEKLPKIEIPVQEK